MIFGLIDFINVLPLYVYLKGSKLQSYTKKTINYKKNVPSKLNKALKSKKIDSAIISSIESRHKKYKNLNIGICANKKVLSVLVEKNTDKSMDSSSATSNLLSKVLGLNGRVVIGDRALYEYLKNDKDKNYIDMCERWYQLYRLPFCFARFSYIKGDYKKMFKHFDFCTNTPNKRIKIPNYILDRYSNTRKISHKDIKAYLHYIYYHIGKKELKALRLYVKKSSFCDFRP